MSISYNPPLKFVLDLDNLSSTVQTTMSQTTSQSIMESISSVNIEIDINNNQLILSKPGMKFETKIIVKKWYK